MRSWLVGILAAILVALISATHSAFALELALAILLGCLVASLFSSDAILRRQAAETALLAIVVCAGAFEVTWLRPVWLAGIAMVKTSAVVDAAVALNLAVLLALIWTEARVWRSLVESRAARWIAALAATASLTVVPLLVIRFSGIDRLSESARFYSDVLPSSGLIVLGAVLAAAVWAGVFRPGQEPNTGRSLARTIRTVSAVAAVIVFALFSTLQLRSHPVGAGRSVTVFRNYAVEIHPVDDSLIDFDVVQSGSSVINGQVLPLPRTVRVQSAADGWMLREFSYKPPATDLGGTPATILVKNLPAGAFNAALLTYSSEGEVEPKRFNGKESASWTLTSLNDGIDFTYSRYAWIPQPIQGWLMVFAGQRTAAQVVLTLLGLLIGFVTVHYRDAPWDIIDKWIAKRRGATPPKAANG